MRVMVTGAAGFIGRHLTRELRLNGHQVVGVDLRTADVCCDVTEPAGALHALGKARPEVVVHLAAVVGRVFGEDDRALTVHTNALGTCVVAQACRAHGARLAYVSTSEVYGDQGDADCVEGGWLEVPHNLYGLSKRWGEEAAALYCPDGLQVLRLSMPYGPGLPAGRGRAAIINFLDQASRGVEIPVHRGAERSWCWVGDTVHGIRRVIESGDQAMDAQGYTSGDGVYNVGRDDDPRLMVDVAVMACTVVGADTGLIREVDPPAAQTVVKRLDTTRLRGLGWTPSVDLWRGLEMTWAAMREATCQP